MRLSLVLLNEHDDDDHPWRASVRPFQPSFIISTCCKPQSCRVANIMLTAFNFIDSLVGGRYKHFVHFVNEKLFITGGRCFIFRPRPNTALHQSAVQSQTKQITTSLINRKLYRRIKFAIAKLIINYNYRTPILHWLCRTVLERFSNMLCENDDDEEWLIDNTSMSWEIAEIERSIQRRNTTSSLLLCFLSIILTENG